jgi:hypothetical protein
MSNDSLHEASTHLEAASATASDDEVADRLAGLSDQLERLAARERGPDHGRLARIENALGEVSEVADAETDAEIDRAHESIVAYRETVDGV